MSTQFWSKVSTNEAKKCRVSNCLNSRYRVSGLCKHHQGIKDRYGHPLGRSISKREYLAEQEDIRAFIDKNIDHPAMKAGIKWFDKLLKNVSAGQHVAAKRELKQLVYAGIGGRECLEAVLSVWLYSHRRPSRLPDDIRLDFAIAAAVLGLATREKVKVHKKGKETYYYRRSPHSTLRGLGKLIRESLAILGVNVFQALDRDLKKEDELKMDMMREL